MASIEDLLAGFPDEQGDIALELRDLVLEVLMPRDERVYMGWKGLGYHTEDGFTCGIFLTESGVRLGFERGAGFDDPEGLLIGDGKQVRYYEIPDWTPEISATARGFLEQALERS